MSDKKCGYFIEDAQFAGGPWWCPGCAPDEWVKDLPSVCPHCGKQVIASDGSDVPPKPVLEEPKLPANSGQKAGMRIIKFRFWEKSSGEGRMLPWDKVSKWYVGDSFMDASMSTPMQFINHTDKNGKEIYEDDIVKITRRGESEVRRVVWGEGAYVFLGGCNISITDEVRRHKPGILEVVGNCYENPEIEYERG